MDSMSLYFDDKENRSREARRAELDHMLHTMIIAGYELSPRLKATLDACQLTPQDITTIDDLEKLPVISREEVVDFELQEPPYGGFAKAGVPTDRIFISPGPVYEPHLTEHDMLWGRGFHAAGFGRGDIVLNTFSYHMVAAGITFHEGLRAVGATVIPAGTTGTETQVRLIRDLKVTGYVGTPSFLAAIIDKAEKMGHDLSSLRKASFVAEPLEPSLREKLEHTYHIDTYQMYGATEVGDIAYECGEKNGWHICENVIVEIIDPATGKKVAPGQLGEVVVTRLNDIFFLVRFGTGDLSHIMTDTCPCGRTAHRLAGIMGRIGDAVKVRGLFIAPSQLHRVRQHIDHMPLQLVITRESHRDCLTVLIDPVTQDTHRDTAEIRQIFQDICTVRVDRIEFTRPGTLGEDTTLIDDRRDWQ